MAKRRKILACRKLEILNETGRISYVYVKIYCPEILDNKGGFRCLYQIEGFGDQQIKEGRGSDALQAVILTVAKIGVDLYKSPEAQAGHLRWYGDRNLGFPVFEAMTQFVPGPKDILVM